MPQCKLFQVADFHLFNLRVFFQVAKENSSAEAMWSLRREKGRSNSGKERHSQGEPRAGGSGVEPIKEKPSDGLNPFLKVLVAQAAMFECERCYPMRNGGARMYRLHITNME